jgi:hypothetical protein
MRSKHVLHGFSKFTDAEITNAVNQISGLTNFREFRITLWATKAFVRFMNWAFAHRTIVLGFHHRARETGSTTQRAQRKNLP